MSHTQAADPADALTAETIAREALTNVGRDYTLASVMAEVEYLDVEDVTANVPTLRDRAMKLRVRHVLLDWFNVTDGIGAWSVTAYWHDDDVVAYGAFDAARLAVVMFERSRVAQAQGF